VEINGEGYFEIVHDKQKPFKVKKEEMEITVLGTHFNVNAYEDESDIKVTLLEGSVKVANDKIVKTIKPGEQAEIKEGIEINKEINMEEVMAWKNGDFVFDGDDLESIMRKISRWYGVDVIYDAKPDKKIHFGGIVSRRKNISAVLKIMQSTGQVNFKVQGRKITVIQN
jgi:ferric-dicitrate binding protein FerR (iron transport regulator)